MNDVVLQRLYRLRDEFERWQLDALLVLNDENRYYLSGFSGRDGQFDESAGALIITSSAQVIATDSRYELQAKNEAQGFEVWCYRKGLPRILPEIVESLQIEHLGFESARLSCFHFEKIRGELDKGPTHCSLVPTEGLIEGLREKKDRAEIQAISEALNLAESVIAHLRPRLSEVRTEKDIAWELEKILRHRGAEAMAFPPIVASGPNAALPHAVPSERLISEGGPLLLDWGCRLNAYCSDISRTVFIGPRDATFDKAFQTVLDAQRFAIAAVKPGVTTQEVDRIARDHIADQGFGGRFGHGLGHGVGLATHEKPHLSPLKPATLEVGMVTTVEPGIYIPDWGGIRLENMVVVEEDGARVLNKLPLEIDL